MQHWHLLLGFRRGGGASAGGLGACAGSFWKETAVQAQSCEARAGGRGRADLPGGQTEGRATRRNLKVKEGTWVPTRSLTANPAPGRPRGGGATARRPAAARALSSGRAEAIRPSCRVAGHTCWCCIHEPRASRVRAAHGAVWGGFILTARGTRAARRASICSGEAGHLRAWISLRRVMGWTRARRRQRAGCARAGPPVHGGRVGFPGVRGSWSVTRPTCRRIPSSAESGGGRVLPSSVSDTARASP